MNRFLLVGLLIGSALTVFGFPATLAPEGNGNPGFPEVEIHVVDEGHVFGFPATLAPEGNGNPGLPEVDIHVVDEGHVFGYPATLAPEGNGNPGLPEIEIHVVDEGRVFGYPATLAPEGNGNPGLPEVDIHVVDEGHVFGYPATLAPEANGNPGLPEVDIHVVDEGQNVDVPKPANQNPGSIVIDVSGGKVVQKRDLPLEYGHGITLAPEYTDLENPDEQEQYFDIVDGEIDMLKSVVKQLALVPKDEELTLKKIDNYFFGDKSGKSSVIATTPDGIDWGVQNIVKQGGLIERAKTLLHFIKTAADLLQEHQETLRSAYENAVKIKGVLDTFLAFWG